MEAHFNLLINTNRYMYVTCMSLPDYITDCITACYNYLYRNTIFRPLTSNLEHVDRAIVPARKFRTLNICGSQQEARQNGRRLLTNQHRSFALHCKGSSNNCKKLLNSEMKQKSLCWVHCKLVQRHPCSQSHAFALFMHIQEDI